MGAGEAGVGGEGGGDTPPAVRVEEIGTRELAERIAYSKEKGSKEVNL